MKYDYKKYLQKVLESEDFIHSPNIQNLLRYLTECSVKGEPAKELQIATNVFKRDLSENDQDSAIVRVNVHNLRKKLIHYYLTKGEKDAIQFMIPKGRYEVEIKERSTETEYSGDSIRPFFKPQKLLVYVIIILISVLVSYFIFSEKEDKEINKVRQSAIWQDFTASDKKTMLVVGDFYFIRTEDTALNRNLMVRDLLINSYQDLTEFLARHPEYSAKYKQAEYTYTGYSIPFVLKELVPVICRNNLKVCLMSQFNARYLQEFNVIFVGLYKTMGLLRSFLDHSGFNVDESKNLVTIKEKGEADYKTYIQKGSSESFHNDYAIVAKFRGPNNNFIFLFSSFHDIGVMESVKQFTNQRTLSLIQEKINSPINPGYSDFEVLFQVIGMNRNDLNSEVIKINPWNSKSMFSDINQTMKK